MGDFAVFVDVVAKTGTVVVSQPTDQLFSNFDLHVNEWRAVRSGDRLLPFHVNAGRYAPNKFFLEQCHDLMGLGGDSAVHALLRDEQPPCNVVQRTK